MTADGGTALFDIILDRPRRRAEAVLSSLPPGFRLRCRPCPGSRRPPRAAQELVSALGLLLETRRRPAGRVFARAESHAGKYGRSLLLRSTFACNQRCPFCSVALSRSMLSPASLERELDFLARGAGPRQMLNISGGEPTVDPHLPAVIASARRRGFRRFQLQTNAVLLARPGLLERLLDLGVTRYFVSFHSHRRRLYDRITASRGLFDSAVAGLTRLLRDRRCRVTVNVVVNALNFRELPGLMGFLAELRDRSAPGRRLEVAFSMINEAGHEKAPAWAVSPGRAAPHLRRAVALCRRAGLRVERFGGESSFPVCLLPQPGRHASPRALPQDRVRYTEDFSGEAGSFGRAKKPDCRLCRFDARCQGIPAACARMFGLAALRAPRSRRR